MHTNLVLVLNVQSYLCNMLQRSSLLQNIPHMTQCLFDKYMKLFNARSNVICTFGFSIKQYISASMIEFSDLSDEEKATFQKYNSDITDESDDNLIKWL